MAAPLTLFDVAQRAMSAQLVRMNAASSNLANAGSISASEADAYRPIRAVFATEMDKASGLATVRVGAVQRDNVTPLKQHNPDHPLADAEGNVWEAAVDSAAELVEMVETARQYQNNVQVLETAKGLINETLRLGQ